MAFTIAYTLFYIYMPNVNILMKKHACALTKLIRIFGGEIGSGSSTRTQIVDGYMA